MKKLLFTFLFIIFVFSVGKAQGKIVVDINSLEFGNVLLGETVKRDIKITNIGNESVDIRSDWIWDVGPNSIGGGFELLNVPSKIDKEVGILITVIFKPVVTGKYETKLIIPYNSGELEIWFYANVYSYDDSPFYVEELVNGNPQTGRISEISFPDVILSCNESNQPRSFRLCYSVVDYLEIKVELSGDTSAFNLSELKALEGINYFSEEEESKHFTVSLANNISTFDHGEYTATVILATEPYKLILTLRTTVRENNTKFVISLDDLGTNNSTKPEEGSYKFQYWGGGMQAKTFSLTVNYNICNDIKVSEPSFSSKDSPFSISDINWNEKTGGNCRINFNTNMMTIGNYKDTLKIETSSPDSTIEIQFEIDMKLLIEVDPNPLDFGNVPIDSSITQKITIKNNYNDTLEISVTITEDVFTLPYGENTITVLEGDSRTIAVQFSPTTTKTRDGFITLEHNVDGVPPTKVQLTGIGVSQATPNISVSPDTLAFGDVLINSPITENVTIKNIGTADLVIVEVAVDGGDGFSLPYNENWKVTSENPIILKEGEIYTLQVRFLPTETKYYDGWLALQHNDFDGVSSVPLTGTGIVPDIIITPDTLAFGDVVVGSTKTDTITINNSGTTQLWIDVTIQPSPLPGKPSIFNAEYFSQIILYPGDSCKIAVQFSPDETTNYTKTALISCYASSIGTLVLTESIPLTGTGVSQATPIITVSPSSLDFGSVEVGTSSSPMSIKIKNSGDTTLVVSDIYLSDGFSLPNGDSTINIEPDDEYELEVQFTPTEGRAYSGNLTLIHNASGSPTVSLSGTGIIFVVDIAPEHIDFGKIRLGTQKDTIVTITNSGTVGVVITSATISGDDTTSFLHDFDSPITLQPNETKTITVTFNPSKLYESGLLIVSHNIVGKDPLRVTLVGTAESPVINITPTTLEFKDVLVDSTSIKILKISNDGNAYLEITSLTLKGEDDGLFSVTADLPITVVPEKYIELEVNFIPTSVGEKIAELEIVHNDNTSPSIVSLTGRGIKPKITITPNPFDFGDVLTNSQRTEDIIIKNSGTADLVISGVSINGDGFTLPKGETEIIVTAGGGSSNLAVQFLPTVTGSHSGTITLKHNATGSPTTINLIGNGITPPTPIITIDIDTFAFGDVTINTSDTKNITIQNSGTADLIISGVFINGDGFTLQNDETNITIYPDSSYNLIVQFLPIIDTKHAGAIILTHNADSSPDTIHLTGRGVKPGIKITLNPLDFGDVTINSSSTQNITIQNSGTADLIISGVSINGDGFTLPNDETNITNMAIKPDSSYNLIVQFLPIIDTNHTGAIILTHNADSSPYTIHLTGRGVKPGITITPDTLDFCNVLIDTSSTQNITITNPGTADLIISQATISGNGFTLHGVTIPPSITIPAGGDSTIEIKFLPTAVRPYEGTITLTHNAENGSSTVHLTGRGIQPARITNTDSNTIINEGDSATISFSISGSNETPLTARIYYKAGGKLQYDSVDAKQSVSNYSYPFEKGKIKETGLYYYIKVEFDDGSIATYPEKDYETNPLYIRVRLKTHQVHTSSAKMYSLISFPFDFEGNKSATKFLEDQLGRPTPYTWRFFAYRGGPDYVEYGKNGFGDGEGIRGEGFWFISNWNTTLNFSDVLTNQAEFDIKLKHGWNIIGNPFLFNIPIENIVLSDGNSYEKGDLSEFEEEIYSPTPPDSMKLYKGYFIYNDGPDGLEITIKPVSSIGSTNKQNLSKAFSDEWKINVVLLEEKGIRDKVEIGAISPASTRFTYYKPPPSPAGGVDMYLVSSNKYFAKYYYSTTDENMIWDLRIKELKKSANYSLNLQKSGNIDDDYELVVIDLGTGDKVALLSNVIHIPSGSTEKTYRIVVGKKQFVKDELYNAEISHYKLHQNYPNPFNPSTTIDYVIAENGHVTLKIYNALGQEVSVLVDGLKDKGKYTVVWNAGNQPSGMYYYKLITRNYSNVKKMILVK